MNTLKIGDKFEDKSYYLIEKAIENDEFGISKSSAKVYRKKGYYSKDRETEIIFDLSIEIWPKNAQRYSLLFLIECKSSISGNNVPVNDIEEFYSKIIQVAGVNVKGVMISDNSFQSGGLQFAKNKGIMLIEVDNEDNHSIILHKTEKSIAKAEKLNIDDLVFNFVKKALGFSKVKGLKKLSTEQIENLALPILQKFNGLASSINISEFIMHLKSEYDLKFDFTQDLENINGKKITGFFNLQNNTILIDRSILLTEKFPFVLGHELGHFFLHRELKVNQERYNDFEDSEYDFFTDRYKLVNDRNWIEWQANKFAISLFLPKVLFLRYLIAYRRRLGIRHPQRIYLDEQTINKHDYYKTVDYMSDYFGISKTTVKFRIEELNLITYAKPVKRMQNIIREIIFE